MFSAVTSKYANEIKEKKVIICNIDLEKKFPVSTNSVVLSILTLQFIKPEHRLKILKSVYNSLCCGGCFILVEKLISDNSIFENCFTDIYYSMKKNMDIQMNKLKERN